MVYPHEHILLRFNGHFGVSSASSDDWSCGIRLGNPTIGLTLDSAKMATLVAAAKVAADSFHNNAQSQVGTNVFLDEVTGAVIGVSGKYTPPEQQTVISIGTPKAGAGSPVGPFSQALVFSLRTAVPRGRASNGRVYWPTTSMLCDPNTGRVPITNVTNRLTQFRSFLNALNTAAAAYDPVAAVIVASNVGGGVIRTVTGVRSDDRLDAIERRENNQVSTWSALTVP